MPSATSSAASIPSGALSSALSVGTARAAAQNQTLSNIRSRTAALLPTAAVSVTFATSVGLLANDPSHGGVRYPIPIAGILLFLVLAIGVVTLVVQWPTSWNFDSGTDVYTGTSDEDAALRAAINQLEDVVAENKKRLGHLFIWFEVGVGLLAAETALVVVGFVLGTNH